MPWRSPRQFSCNIASRDSHKGWCAMFRPTLEAVWRDAGRPLFFVMTTTGKSTKTRVSRPTVKSQFTGVENGKSWV